MSPTVGAALRRARRVRALSAVETARAAGIYPPEYRLRVGDYRVRFEQDEASIRILRVRHRREVYR